MQNSSSDPNDKETSWGGVASWYDKLLEEGPDSYQTAVILPNLIRLVAPHKGQRVLDLACGQGFFSRAFQAGGASVTGVDIGEELIKLAKARSSADHAASTIDITFHVASADKIDFLKDASFDVINITLAIQNIDRFQAVFTQCSRVLAPGGKLVLTLNHPTFRVPSASSWGYDEEKNSQYRRVDSYLSESKASIVMNPGDIASNKGVAQNTISFHRPLQAYMKALEKAGFAVSRLEEWTSHKKSEKGPRQVAEDRARKEIPLFLMMECVKLAK